MRNRHSPINPRRCSLSHDGRQAAFLSLSLSPRDPTQSDLRTRVRGWHGEITAPSVVEERYIIMHYAARSLSLSFSFAPSLSLSFSRSLGGTRGERRMSCTVSRSLSIVVRDDDFHRGRNCCASQRYRATRANVPLVRTCDHLPNPGRVYIARKARRRVRGTRRANGRRSTRECTRTAALPPRRLASECRPRALVAPTESVSWCERAVVQASGRGVECRAMPRRSFTSAGERYTFFHFALLYPKPPSLPRPRGGPIFRPRRTAPWLFKGDARTALFRGKRV